MSFDNTCCGTTCDAKANAEYVAELEGIIRVIDEIVKDNYYDRSLGCEVRSLWENNEEFFIKVAQQSHNTTGVS